MLPRPWKPCGFQVSVIKKLSYIPYYNSLNIPQRPHFPLSFLLLDEGGQEVGNGGQDSVQDALDNNKQTVDDKVQGADKTTESEDQRLDESEDTI